VDLVLALGVGLMLGRLQPSMAARLATPLVPFSISALLLRPGLRWQLLEAALIALPVIGLGLLFLRGLAHWNPSLRLSAAAPFSWGEWSGTPPTIGILAALALLPPEAVAYSVSYDVSLGVTLRCWALGPTRHWSPSESW